MPSRPKKPWPFRIEFPPELPISARANEIIGLLQKHQVLVLAGETGSGKTTQLPKMCLAAGCGERGKIACTQPRRVAATSVARRVAEELNVALGREVGCKIRFADQTSRETVIKFMTDGMLLAELQNDPFLGEYDTIIVDEAHERSLNIDFILGHLRRLRLRRPELKIVITSATIDTEAFSKAFDDAPIVEVSGRMYPVEVIYAPLDELGDSEGRANPPGEPKNKTARRDASPYQRSKPDDFTYIDAAVEAVERVLTESSAGDILVFMPTERDIRETCDLLEGRGQSKIGNQKSKIEMVPLFGRLTNAEQQRVFAPSQKRKVVVATNIAETSLTIPGIRFVIDTGLARLSRYTPQSRTRRLPVEPVAQSSADQRKGRCGRVSDGVCIRLYSEQDFNDRPRYTQPEIQRSNLADVILRMKAFGLGDIEEFPFLNAPPVKGIRAGYGLLEELGALIPKGRANSPSEPRLGGDASPYLEQELTELGRELASLPADPTVGRMIIQGRHEKALREVLIIAAALSIQDPRERPLDQQAKADAAHRRFTHPDSDFLTLLAIWEAYHDEFERLSLGKLRKFCTTHYLSFMRMREWRDVHAQLEDVLREREGFKMTSVYDGTVGAGLPRDPKESGRKAPPTVEPDLRMGTPGYRAIHRAILSGLLGNIATRADDGTYHAAHDRKVSIFPGSALHEKGDREKKKSGASSDRGAGARPGHALPAKIKVARWLMAAEIMETGKVYARTCARIDPQWAIDLGAHLLRVAHSEPFWNAEAGRVLVKERRRLYNLELETRAVSYGKLNPRHATEIFIREGLVADTVTWPFDFLANNRKVRDKAETILTRTRSSGYMDLDEAAYQFYARRLMPEESVAGAAAPSPRSEGDEGVAPPVEPRAAGDGRAVRDSRSHPKKRDEGAASPDQGVSSVPELIDLVRHRQMTDKKFLWMTEANLRPAADTAHDAEAFPDALPIKNRVMPLAYSYQPGQEQDGVTVRVSIEEADALTPAALDWAVPGHLQAKIELLLKALPKGQRREVIPLAESAERISAQIGLLAARPVPPTLVNALAELLSARFGVRIAPSLWDDKPLPDHLRVRVEVADRKGKVLCASRDLAEIKELLRDQQRDLSQQVAAGDSAAWRNARAKWETEPANSWQFGDLPEQITVAEQHGVPVPAYPGLKALPAGVAVRLFATEEERTAATRAALFRLFEVQLKHELGWLGKDLRELRALGPLSVTLVPLERLQEHALLGLARWACDPARMGGANSPRGGTGIRPGEPRPGGDASPYRLTAAGFAAALDEAKRDLRGAVPRLLEGLKEVLTLRLALQTHRTPYPGMAEDLAALVPADFLLATPFERLKQLPRYLKAMQLRAERWPRDAAKDAARAKELAPFVAAVRKGAAGTRSTEGGAAPASRSAAAAETLRWLVEEFRVSLFAQELGTAEPVSAVRLARALAELRAGGAEKAGPAMKPATPPQTSPTAPPAAAKPTEKTVFKSLGALANLRLPR
ncbi:MAG: ATP-dependent RNA helicase HrpA [Opitutae bacterium]|nr:ATP-dependent RNA helicase HrpA [Opitutae bacterium]